MLDLLPDNVLLKFKSLRIHIGLPMCTDGAPVLAGLFTKFRFWLDKRETVRAVTIYPILITDH